MRGIGIALGAVLAAACVGGEPDADLFDAVGAHDNGLTLELVRAGADLEARDERGCTPLVKAAWSMNAEGVRILLEHGADPDAPCLAGSPSGSALFYAGDPEILDLLLGHGADLERRSGGDLRVPLLFGAATVGAAERSAPLGKGVRRQKPAGPGAARSRVVGALVRRVEARGARTRGGTSP